MLTLRAVDGQFIITISGGDMWQQFVDALPLAADFATAFGIPVAIFTFLMEKRRERREREYGTYDALDEKYIEFQRLCLEYPQLDVFDGQELKRTGYTPEEERMELILFTILFSVLERAHLMYKGHRKRMKEDQWEGWDEEIIKWCGRGRFLRAWALVGDNYDKKFTDYMKEKIAELTQK